jgi:hypothetical protein
MRVSEASELGSVYRNEGPAIWRWGTGTVEHGELGLVRQASLAT